MLPKLAKIAAEPLVHFLAIGLVLFVASEILKPEVDDPRTIKIDLGVQSHLSNLFEADRGQLPSEAEMDELVEVYIRNETLYREARALKLDDGDDMMRERLAQRMRLMLYSGISVGQPTEEELRAWFDEKGQVFDQPALLTLEIIGLDATQDEALAVAEEAIAREGTENPMRSPEVTLVSFKKRPMNQLQRLFGDAFMARIDGLPEGEWAAIESPRGWQVARLIERVEPVPARFEDVAEDIRGRWREERKQADARAALSALMQTYPVEREPYASELLRSDGGDVENKQAARQ